jgi:hypothetical protein
LTPFGEACLRTDLTAIHEILEKIGYKDDEGIANEVCQLLFVIDGLFLLLKNVTILTPESIK